MFVKASEMLRIAPQDCLVVEDANAGIEAGKKGGMKTFGVRGAKNADFEAESLEQISVLELMNRKK